MTPVELDQLPPALNRMAVAAGAAGWDVTATLADGPPPSVCLRFAHDHWRAYSTWKVDGGSIKWWSGAARHLPPGKFSTLGAMKTWLGIA